MTKSTTEEGWTTTVEPYGDPLELEEGGVFEGIYVGSEVVATTGFDGEPRDSTAYRMTNIAGRFTVWGGYSIDKGMSEVPVGSQVRLTYHGKREIKGGKQTVQEWTVQYRAQ